MGSPSHEFVTVEMRGLKSRLAALAQSRQVSVSSIVRAAVERDLEAAHAINDSEPHAQSTTGLNVKLSIRLRKEDAGRLDAGAQHAGLSRGAFLTGLLDGVPVLAGDGPGRAAVLRALTASNTELATLSRRIHRLVSLLRAGQVEAAREHRQRLEALDGEVRAHLGLAAGVLAELRPARTVNVRSKSAPQSAA